MECHAIKSWNEEDAVKKAQLSPDKLANVISALNEDGLRHLSRDYKLHRFVVDSWMEWDITLEQPSHRQNVTLAFSGGSDQATLPEALGKLGCLILELRRSAYGDDTSYYSEACTGR